MIYLPLRYNQNRNSLYNLLDNCGKKAKLHE